MSSINIPVKCCRCRNEHMDRDRPRKPMRVSEGAIGMSTSVCPRCGCSTFYDLRPQVAWCYASGLIETGDAAPCDNADCSGVIVIARGPKYALKGQLGAAARHGMGASKGELLVPGVPEADSQKEKADALEQWLSWLNRRKPRDGVIFAKGLQP